MKKLLSLPPNVVESFHDITGVSRDEYFCTSDPADHRVGSGGGTAWLLEQAYQATGQKTTFGEWLGSERRILLHAGGQSRRLPAYAPTGKVLTPIPVMRWARGEKIDQTLLDIQLPLYERIMSKAHEGQNTLVVSGDMAVRVTKTLNPVPDADVVCYGLWVDPVLASHHGVFYMNRNTPNRLDFMLQKPSIERQTQLMPTHFALMDIGIWLLSDRAVERLMDKCKRDGEFAYYDLYTTFGGALGDRPSQPDGALADLSVAILPLEGGEFYHFGTTPELLSSTLALQNLVQDQRIILKMGVKKHPSVFTQNAVIERLPDTNAENIWIENSYIPASWHLTADNVITGVPRNNWAISLRRGICVDIVPIDEDKWAIRPYGYDDPFRGPFLGQTTQYLGGRLHDWLAARGIGGKDDGEPTDLQDAPIFPVVDSIAAIGKWLTWMIADQPQKTMTSEFLALPRLSADQIMQRANLRRLARQREDFRRINLPALAANWRKSVFHQTDLSHMRRLFVKAGLELPPAVPQDAPLMTRIHDAMFHGDDETSFELLSQGLVEQAKTYRSLPVSTTYSDQIVWGRSPVRIDVAGGWTDTPPYSLYNGGAVVNLAIDLNGQQPLQVYVKPSKELCIVCRSIDLGAEERFETYDELRQYNRVGSPFSIPKAALALAGFVPEFCKEQFSSLKRQLEAFGSGLEVTLLSAIPAGSGLGTSSILAATVLGALSDFCGLGWERTEICNRTLILEQLLTTGGGWQDQYGGVFPGVKYFESRMGFDQTASVRWLPDTLFESPEYKPCHLLYYTGVTRTAKDILAEIVRGMFLNTSAHINLLDNMRGHAAALFDTIQRNNFEEFGRMIRTTWEQNCLLDSGTNPPIIQELCARIDDLCAGYKLPGAGGGGFLYMVAKDPDAAMRIRQLLNEDPLTPNSRFVEMSISQTGLQVSRS